MRSIGAASSGASSGISSRFHWRELFRSLRLFLSLSLSSSLPLSFSTNALLYVLFRHFSIIMHCWLFLGLFRGPIDRNERFQKLRSVLRKDRGITKIFSAKRTAVASRVVHVLLLIFRGWRTCNFYLFMQEFYITCVSHAFVRTVRSHAYETMLYIILSMCEKTKIQKKKDIERTCC